MRDHNWKDTLSIVLPICLMLAGILFFVSSCTKHEHAERTKCVKAILKSNPQATLKELEICRSKI